MVRAYVLVKFDSRADLSKVPHALQQRGVKKVDMVLGPYDAVVQIECPSQKALGELAKQMRGCPGISDTLTCLVV